VKIAYCLHGLLGFADSKGNSHLEPEYKKVIDPKIGHSSFLRNIAQNHEVDVFVHSWSHQHEHLVDGIYHPKKLMMEKQIDFHNDDRLEILAHNNSFSKKARLFFKRKIDEKKYNEIIEKNRKTSFRSMSRWYSTKKSIELCKHFSETNKIKYDLIFLSRFDIEFFTSFDFTDYNESYFWASHWNKYPTSKLNQEPDKSNQFVNSGLMDLWFFAKPEYMFSIMDLYDRVHKYSRSPHFAIFQHLMLKGIPINYTKFRWYDYDLIRRHKLGSRS